MSWVSGIAVYFIIWWTALFLVLPWGVRPVSSDDVAKGHAAGAPQRPHMWRRVAATTLVAAVLWLVVYVVIETGVISIRTPLPR
jgi:predicted secreted protein